ncbi:MAG: FO synthase [Halioglobus sp.]|jgi:FO synthase
MSDWSLIKASLERGALPSHEQALSLALFEDTSALAQQARVLRDRGHGNVVTYSRKVFIPLTQLCRDVCHYCTFAQTPSKIEQPFMPIEEVLELCREGARMGCQEALFTLGEKPELRYNAARRALEEMGYATTLDYVKEVASRVLAETGMLPHINAGCMTAEEIAGLRTVSASMGIMLESGSQRLCQKGMPHYGSPDKDPAKRLETLALAGQACVPFTSGILIGIGETRLERIESLLALREVHDQYGHLQEVIVQNFRAKPGTLMSEAPEPDLNELLWTIAVARLIFGAQMNIQAPPNLSPGVLPQLVDAGINDWGGVSPLTPDHVNPEAPWPHLDRLTNETATAGKFLEQRLTIYAAYAIDGEKWLDPAVRTAVLRQSDAAGFARRDDWAPGSEQEVPEVEARLLQNEYSDEALSTDVKALVQRCWQQDDLSESQVTRLFNSRGADFSYVVEQANLMREQVNGDTVSYVVNRNINYTNVCYFKCQFCAFSKGKQSENLRGRPYDISGEDIAQRCMEAWDRGATEVCMQGGIHPDYTGQTYLDIVSTVRAATPNMHIHAFSPLEVWQGAQTLGIGVATFLKQLREAGLSTLPGTAAEILHDEVRADLCPDKINTSQWLEVMAAAHEVGMRTTATIMYGHIDRPRHWASHLLKIRALQQRTGGFTEFVPLPFVHMEAPMYLKGNARKGPSFREALLMHAVARLVFHGLIDNIQASWVKMGRAGVTACLNAGVNDLGGSLMNESITRAAGSEHGQEWAPENMEAQIRSAKRSPRMRTTLYGDAPQERHRAAMAAEPLVEIEGASAAKQQRSKRLSQEFLELIPSRSLAVEAVPISALAHSAAKQNQDSALYHQVVLMAACN